MHVLSVNETWLDSSIPDANIFIPGYNVHRRDRTTHGGGVCLYIRNTLQYKSVTAFQTLEGIALTIRLPSASRRQQFTAAICSVYRPPASNIVFWADLKRELDPLISSHEHAVVLGDFNTNILEPTSHHINHLKGLTTELCLQNVVHAPTRHISQACLDLALLTPSLPPHQVSVHSAMGISDHDLVKLDFSMPQTQTFSNRKFIHTRTPHPTQIPADTLNASITTKMSSQVSSLPDHSPSAWASLLSTTLVDVLDEHAPIRRKVVPQCPRPRPQPWVDSRLRTLLTRRAYLHRKTRKNPYDPVAKRLYRANRREGTLLNRRLKSEYLQSQFQHLQHNPRGQWALLNRLAGRSQVRSQPKASLTNLTSTFANIVEDPTRPASLRIPIIDDPPFASFKQVTSAEVEKLLGSVNQHKSTGSDGIPACLLRNGASSVAPFFRDIINESFSTGQFPDIYKLANIHPILKRGDPELASNYRPISLLPILSKLLERIVLRQLTEYLNSDKCVPSALPPEQFAYRANHSCEDALALAVDRWHQALDRGEMVGVVCVDLSKAFDRVRHNELIQTLADIGVGGSALEWFADYLTSRSQRVCVGQELGSASRCQRGVPQGSVLGPLLFSLYVRTVPNKMVNKNQLFADDICIYRSGRSIVDITASLNTDLKNLDTYLSNIGLLLNPSKTQFLLLHKRSVTVPIDTCLQCNGCPINLSQYVKYLGVYIDQHLSFDRQVQHVCESVHKKLGAFRHGRRNLSVSARRLFYLSIVQSTLEYGSNAYFHSLSAALHDRLIITSQIAMRKAFGLSRFTSTEFILQKYKLYSLLVRLNIKLFVFTFRVLHNRTSPLLQPMFTFRDAAAHTSLRTRGQTHCSLALPPCRTRFGFHSISFLAADRWNGLPVACRRSQCLPEFVHHLKQFLVPRAPCN